MIAEIQDLLKSATAAIERHGMKRKKRILVFGHDPNRGGAQGVMAQCARILNKVYDVRAVLPSEGEIASDLREAAVDTTVARMIPWYNLTPEAPREMTLTHFFSDLEERISAIEKMICDYEPEIVVCNTAVIIEPVIAALRRGIPVIWYIHEMTDNDELLQQSGFVNIFKILASQRTVHLLLPCDAATKQFRDWLHPHKTDIIHYGVDVPSNDPPDMPVSPEYFNVVFSANLNARKGVDCLVAAINIVTASHSKVRFFIAGNLCEYSHDQFMNQFSSPDQVQLLGFVNDINQALSQFDLAIMPSRCDTYPLAVLEAMAAGIAVIGTRSGGMAEQIIDGETGLLIEIDDHRALAEKIVQLADDRDLCAEFGREARSVWQKRNTTALFEERFNKYVQEVLSIAQRDNGVEPTFHGAFRDLFTLTSSLGRESALNKRLYEESMTVLNKIYRFWPVRIARFIKRVLSRRATVDNNRK